MSNPRDAYLERERCLTALLTWFQAEVDCHSRKALLPENAATLSKMSEELRLVTAEILPAFHFLSGMTVAEIEEQLGQEGTDNE